MSLKFLKLLRERNSNRAMISWLSKDNNFSHKNLFDIQYTRWTPQKIKVTFRI